VDSDGRIDLLPINWFRGNHSRLLRNVSDTKNNWIRISVVGKTFNRQGIGTRIEVFSGEERIGCGEIATGYGYASGQVAKAHFGLGDAARISLQLRFPDGSKREMKGISTLNQEIVIEE
jgi:hypothetical protein